MRTVKEQKREDKNFVKQKTRGSQGLNPPPFLMQIRIQGFEMRANRIWIQELIFSNFIIK